jgi:tetratricopeptide (TPR) repeat protein
VINVSKKQIAIDGLPEPSHTGISYIRRFSIQSLTRAKLRQHCSFHLKLNSAEMTSVDHQITPVPSQDDYYDLGTYRQLIDTGSSDAQTWFDRGLLWSYGFNHEEAAKCFSQAIAHDDQCAMAYWGLAYALGPNYNKPWEIFDLADLEKTLERAHNAAVRAKTYATTKKPVEQALVDAIQHRYPVSRRAGDDFSKWNLGYANAMADVYEKFPHDLGVAALYADALMNLHPWALWVIETAKPTEGARTLEIQEILEQALAKPGGRKHPGLLHLYIHFMEMSPTPEAALAVADELRGLVPDSGHLNHMPSHLDMLCGDYRRAVASNQAASAADNKFLTREGPINFYTLYRSHDYHFTIWAAMFAAQSRPALEATTYLENSIPEELLRVASPPMADWLEGFCAIRPHVLVRFGRWQEILDTKLPHDQELYCTVTATIHYSKGVALAALGRLEDAEAERTHFLKTLDLIPPTRVLFSKKSSDTLRVGEAMLDGEIEYRKGNFEAAFSHLCTAIKREDELPYDEPWGWMQPTRHAYGALLLEQDRVEEAATVYASDLGFNNSLPRQLQHPNNVWALAGYSECLRRLDRHAEARILAPQLRLALATADVPVTSSCYCRLGKDGEKCC